MKYFSIALETEWLKFRHALVPKLATIGIVAVIAFIGPISMLGRGEEASLIAASWSEYFSSTALRISTAGLFGYGIVIVWLFGREFAEGTITGLFALPVSRGQVALAKIVLFVLWVEVTTLMLCGVLILVGAALGLGEFSADAWIGVGRLFVISVLTALLTFPFALVATVARNYLAPIGVILAVAIVTSVVGSLDVGVWFPFAIPGLWAAGEIEDGDRLVAHLLLVPLMALIFKAWIVRMWTKLEL
jgi:ABC-2 type transport system permease protein